MAPFSENIDMWADANGTSSRGVMHVRIGITFFVDGCNQYSFKEYQESDLLAN